MDADDVQRLLTQTQLRCLLLEADKDAENLRAGKYRKILGRLAGEDDATQPQAADNFHMPRLRPLINALRPTSSLTEGQVVGSTIARCPSVHSPVAGRSRPSSDRTAAVVLQAHSDSDEDTADLDEPHTGGSTSTSVSQPGSKKRNLSSHENPARSISTRSRASFDIPPESSRISTSGPRGPSMFMPSDIVDVAGILNRAGLMPLELTRAEATCVEETPGIGWATFSRLFGGYQRSEWPQCSRFSGYSDFLCTDVIAQPFVPHAAGKPGLLLRPPTVIETPESEKYTIHVLSNTRQGDGLHYRGKYTRVPVPETHFQVHWSDLPRNFQERWTKRVYNAQRTTTRALCARIQLRDERRREPSAIEVQAHLQCFDVQVTYKEVAAAFKSGEEKLALEGLRCTGYDSFLATTIQRAVQAND